MDIYTYLKNDHHKVTHLFKRVASATKAETKKTLLYEIKQELLLHAETEHQTFYRALAQDKSMKDIIEHADEEHEKIKKQLTKLSSLSPEDNQWKEQLKLLKNMVSHHVESEETEIFTQAKKILNAQQSKKLAEDMERLKQSQTNG